MTQHATQQTTVGRANGSSTPIPQYYGVVKTATDDWYEAVDAADEHVDGIVQEKVDGAEQSIAVAFGGITMVIAGGALDEGDPLRTDSVGRMVEAKGSCTITCGANTSLDYTETDAGRGKITSILYENPGIPSNTGYVELIGTTVRAMLSTNTAGVISETADSLKTLLAAHTEIAALLSAADSSGHDGSGTLTAKAATPLTGARNILGRAKQSASGAGSQIEMVIERKEV